MKQNAAGLANICILATMVLVMISGTVSLYLGMDDSLRTQYPRNIEIQAKSISKAESDSLEEIIEDEISKSGFKVTNTVKYRFMYYTFNNKGTLFTFNRDSSSKINDVVVFLIPLYQYNELQGTSVSLAQNELMIYSPNVNYTEDTISFDNINYSVKSKLDALNVEEYSSIQYTDTYYFIVPDEESIEDIYNCVTGGDGDWNGLYYYYGLDVSGERENQTILYEKISSRIFGMTPGEGSLMSTNTQCAEYYRTDFLSVYGGFFFLGIFLSILFNMATVL
jgi:putative ABC transport system permease protein